MPSPDRFCPFQRPKTTLFVIPAKAGIQFSAAAWIPAFAGMTKTYSELVLLAVIPADAGMTTLDWLESFVI
jgi:hypothetical protein